MFLPNTGYKLKPNQMSTYTLDKPVDTNSVGFRDHEWQQPKPLDQIRVMILGDSLTFGNGVRGEDTYPKVLERQLRSEFRNIEVLSAAVQGWATHHEARFFQKEGIVYDPDIVVIGFYINDFASAPPASEGSHLTEEGRWEGRPSWIRWLPYKYLFLIKRSALVTYLRVRVAPALLNPPDRNTKLLENNIHLGSDKDILDTWSYILAIKALCDKKGADLILASIPSVNFFRIPKGSVKYISFLRERSQKHGIDFIDLSRDFWEERTVERFYLYPWDGHLSPAGHALVARQLAPLIKGMIAAVDPGKADSAHLSSHPPEDTGKIARAHTWESNDSKPLRNRFQIKGHWSPQWQDAS